MDKTIVEISGLSKTFKDVKAVKDLSLTVFEKDIYGFLGPNGSGKSTSIRMMLSLIRPDEGSIKIFGQDLQKHRNNILVKMGAFVEKADFYEHLSARRNLELLARYSGVNISDKRYEEVLDLVGLSSRSGSKVKTYSKGMKQRLGIAQALLHEPELLVLDEPASGLDPSGMRDIRELIRFLNEEKQITIILSSHNLQEIELIAKRMIIINKGVKIVEGHVHELLQQYNYFTVFNLNDAKKGWNILKESQIPFEKDDTDSSNLRILCQRNEVSRINELFVENGLEIYGIKTEQNLEDYFLNLT